MTCCVGVKPNVLPRWNGSSDYSEHILMSSAEWAIDVTVAGWPDHSDDVGTITKAWPGWTITIVHGLVCAVGGGLAIGICATVYFLTVWPIGGIVSTLPFAHVGTDGAGLTAAAGFVILGLALTCGAAVSGLSGALLTSTLRTNLRNRAPQEFARSVVVWGLGCALSVYMLILVSPHVGDRLPILVLFAMVSGIVICFIDALLTHTNLRQT